MLNFNFHRATDYYFGREQERRAGEICLKHRAARVLIVYGGGSVVRSGLLAEIEKSLNASGVFHAALGGVQPNPRDDLVYEGIEMCRRQNLGLVLAVGGGSVMDTAKAIAMGVPYEGDFWDFFMGGKVPARALPVGCVVTIAASGSEGSNSAVISKTVDGVVKKKGSNFETSVPAFAILNPELTFSVPPFQTACGAADIMCHVMERYFSNTRDVPVTDEFCEGLLRTMVRMFPRVMLNPEDYEARAAVLWAGTLAHNNICGVDREQDWASHRFEMELSAYYGVAHAAGLTVLMPAWMEYVLEHNVMRFARFAVRVFGCAMDYECPENTARAGIRELRRLWGEAGLPLNLRAMAPAAREEDLPLLVKNHGPNPEGHFVVLYRDDFLRILERAWNYAP